MNRIVFMTKKIMINNKKMCKKNKIYYSIVNKRKLTTFLPPENPNNFIYIISAIIFGSYIVYKKY